jgi:hypothetical protein
MSFKPTRCTSCPFSYPPVLHHLNPILALAREWLIWVQLLGGNGAECTLRVPLDCSDAAGDWAGYLRTWNRRRARKKTLWELCTMIPISALR